MADNKEDRSRKSQPNNGNNRDRRSGHRRPEENPPNVRPSRDRTQPMSSHAQLMSVPHLGIQSHPPMEVDITQRNTSGQIVQPQGNSSSDTDQQLATASSVHTLKNKGPTQFGEKNIVNYNITNYNHYHCHCPHHHDGNSPPSHDPTHCPPCLQYHNSDHPPLAEHHRPHPQTPPRHLGLPHHPVPQPPPSGQQTEQTESPAQRGNGNSRTDTTNEDQTRKPESEKQTVGQRSSTSGQSVQASDVTPNVTHVKKRAKKPVKPVIASNEVPKSQTSQEVSRSAETRHVSNDEVPNNVTIIDSRWSSLMPGDVVYLSASYTNAVYIGNQEVVYSDLRGSQVVKRQRLELTEPFEKCRVVSVGDVRPFPRGEVIRRAESRVGTEFTEGEWWDGSDFHYWAMSGLGGDQVGDETAGTDLTSMSTPPIYTLCS